MGKGTSNKVFVIGLDGETYRVIGPLLTQGVLPHMRNLIDKGTHGILMSTVPPVTAPAWSTFMTGTNPGKHGVYSFIQFNYDEGRMIPYDRSSGYPVNGNAIHGKRIWEIVSESGKRVISINMPMTYPPRKINGLMISCFFTPPGSRDYTYPPSLIEELEDYEIDVDFGQGFGQFGRLDRENFNYLEAIASFTKVLEKRAETALKLMKREDWDLFAICFTETDRLHHLLWRFADPSCPSFFGDFAEKIRNAYERFYKILDQAIYRLVQCAGDDTSIIILSDHGFRSSPQKSLLLNKWLYTNGFLNLEEDGGLPAEGSSSLFSKIKKKIRQRIGFQRSPKSTESSPLTARGNLPRINWSLTQAWAESLLISTVGIRINVKGKMGKGYVDPKEYDAVRNRLEKLIVNIKDPQTGNPIVKKINRREEIYNGDFMKDAPDIIVTLDPNYDLPLNMLAGIKGESFVVPSGEQLITGTHESEGIYVFSGAGIRRKVGFQGPYSIEDIAPTVLYLLAIPIPDNMDGKVLWDVIDGEYFGNRPVQYQDAMGFDSKNPETPEDFGWSSKDDAEKIKERLRNLGYL